MAHRGAVDADGVSGDGAGVLTAIPWKVLGVTDPAGLAVGLVFLPRRREAATCARRLLTTSLAAHGLELDCWREVPTREAVLGARARASRPDLFHVFVTRDRNMTADEFETRLAAAGKETEERAAAHRLDDFYIASLSHRTIVYKAMVRGSDLAEFYPDLQDARFETSFVLFHQRFSTNTAPSWPMTQPFRFLGHNGEINTLSGNRNWMRAHGRPLTEGWSDSASLDEAFALTARTGAACRGLLQTWQGPALVVFSDGRTVGAALDRNGLRPARYVVTADGIVLVASEAGVLDAEEAMVMRRGRIGPGGLLEVDLVSGRVINESALAEAAAETRASVPSPARDPQIASPALLRAFGYTHDELQLILGPMFEKGAEPIGSMGDDAPLAILSDRPQLLFSYFKQRFAQVTNPAIDPLRESLVMSLGPDPILDDAAGVTLSLLFTRSLDATLEQLTINAAEAVRDGARDLVLSDRGVDDQHAAIPSLLAVAAVHQQLIREGLRLRATITVDTGEARDDHHIAALIGYGADKVCPWLALDLAGPNRERYRQAIHKGLLKILAKMGVCTLEAYRGAGLFEAVGVANDLIDRHFTGTPSMIGGIGIDDIERETLARHTVAFESESPSLEDAGIFRYRRNGESHAFEPRVVKALHTAIASGKSLDYRSYAELVHSRNPIALRDLVEFRSTAPAPPARGWSINEVEPVPAIVRRFMTAAMSLGALSSEAQGILAAGMNRLNARSNSGEGGEPAEITRSSGRNRIKQIASGRFGVNAAYLTSADEIQIKIAQGSKPGEGGQLPGHKVTPFIARIRNATPGQTLISPPPHHDIYSIEDLAQLIYDLKRVNPSAAVSVKLVSSAGIGAIAVGVAKAHADAIEISGHDGGTGASPLGSIKNAGTPWELGLKEAHAALVQARLRERVRLGVNGGLKTGRDVVIAALLGAEEFAFGTAALVAAGCVMARQCHLNTCPVGIATQRDDLRARFKGTPDDVVRFFTAVADEVRGILALLGARSLDEIIGRSDLLESRLPATGKAAKINLAPIIRPALPQRWAGARNDPPQTGSRIDEAVLEGFRLAAPIPITNADRSVGGRIAGAMSKGDRHPSSVDLAFHGTAGQSFGAFCVDGMRLLLDGQANDGVGKGMSGGEIVVRGSSTTDVIAGNAILYGATGGRLFIAGRAGERFAVRNSGAFAVVEGTGDHACEYMTAGAVVILGPTGVNVAAGMTGGALFFIDVEGTLADRVNSDSVLVGDALADEGWLYDATALHLEATGSASAAALLAAWPAAVRKFRRVTPRDCTTAAPLPQIIACELKAAAQ
jgi:glutamate synthase domain-containing protein 2/glutamate synthase domain-containing protein 3/glutamate synthase domain-containing protein 1